MGNQVEQLKGYLEQALGIPFGAQSIFLDASDGEFMIDPLSLSDYKTITPAKPTHIFVKVCWRLKSRIRQRGEKKPPRWKLQKEFREVDFCQFLALTISIFLRLHFCIPPPL
jgi:hypothetical protein